LEWSIKKIKTLGVELKITANFKGYTIIFPSKLYLISPIRILCYYV
jgi:hypothetical protein